MNLKKLEELNTLADARDAYANLLSVHEATLAERANDTAAIGLAREEVKALREDLTAANEMLDEANTNISSLTDQLNQARESEQTLSQNLNQAEEQVKGLETRIKHLEADAKSAEAKAAQICASVGVEPVQVTPGGEPKQQSLVEQMRSIKDPAQQMAFFRKNKEAILRGK